MNKLTVSLVAGLMLSFGVYPTLAFAEGYALTDGTYRAKFPNNWGCGTMVIKSGGKKISYSAGPCGGDPNYNHSGSFDGKVIRIQNATYTLSSATTSSLKGRWKLGGNSATVTFKK